MSHMIRYIAAESKDDEGTAKGIRAFTFHPAIAFTSMAENSFGIKADTFDYDDSKTFPALVTMNMTMA
jgi:hypothetical protein